MKMTKIKGMAAITAIAAATALTATVSADFLIPTGATTVTAVADIYDAGEAWIKIWNQWNEASMFVIDEVNSDTKDIIISFDVEGCDGSYQAMTGFGINGWSPSIWSEEEYVNAIGGVPTYIIDHDGAYEMIVPFNLFMQAVPIQDEETGADIYKEYLESIDCLELCIRGISEDSTMVVTIKDVTQSSTAHSFSECELSGTAAASNDTESNAAETTASNAATAGDTNSSAASDKGNADTGAEGVAGLIGASLIAAAVICVAGKKRK